MLRVLRWLFGSAQGLPTLLHLTHGPNLVENSFLSRLHRSFSSPAFSKSVQLVLWPVVLVHGAVGVPTEIVIIVAEKAVIVLVLVLVGIVFVVEIARERMAWDPTSQVEPTLRLLQHRGSRNAIVGQILIYIVWQDTRRGLQNGPV
jgi:hypothetical protein